MSQMWFNDIKDAVFPILLEQQAKDNCEYSQDLVAYSANGKRCVHIYDTPDGCDWTYLLIASQNINDQWSKGEVLTFGVIGADGILEDVDNYLTQP